MAATIAIPLSREARRALRTAAQMCDTSEEEFARTAIESSIMNLTFGTGEVPQEFQPERPKRSSRETARTR